MWSSAPTLADGDRIGPEALDLTEQERSGKPGISLERAERDDPALTRSGGKKKEAAVCWGSRFRRSAPRFGFTVWKRPRC